MSLGMKTARSAAMAIALAALTPAAGAYPDPVPGSEQESGPDITTLTGKPRSYLGIGVAEITSKRAGDLNLKEEHGVEITRVEDDSPAAKGGLKPRDVVLEYNGQRVEGVEQFMRLVRETPPGRDVQLSVFRSGSNQLVTVRTGTRKNLAARLAAEHPLLSGGLEMRNFRIPDVPRAIMSWRNSMLGIEGESLDQQLAAYFGVKEGVLVRSVVKGSAADKAGMRAGDVIVRVQEARVATPREVTDALRAARLGTTVTLEVMRERREVSLSVPLTETESGARAGRN